jgi:hypothetical protein
MHRVIIVRIRPIQPQAIPHQATTHRLIATIIRHQAMAKAILRHRAIIRLPQQLMFTQTEVTILMEADITLRQAFIVTDT